MSFFQSPPRVESAFTGDPMLRSWLRRTVPEGVHREIEPSLARMGELAAGELFTLGESHRLDEPRYVPFDPWGHRIDRVEVNAAWLAMARVAATEGVVGTAYERRHGAYSRVHQFALVHLFAPSSQSYSCPLAMTDGCARTLELLAGDALRERVLPRLLARDPSSGVDQRQWMTERTGGSDVGLSETTARPGDDGTLPAPRNQVVHVGGDERGGADARSPRGQPAGRQGARAVLPRRSRRAGRAEPHRRSSHEGEARDAAPAHGRAAPSRGPSRSRSQGSATAFATCLPC